MLACARLTWIQNQPPPPPPLVTNFCDFFLCIISLLLPPPLTQMREPDKWIHMLIPVLWVTTLSCSKVLIVLFLFTHFTKEYKPLQNIPICSIATIWTDSENQPYLLVFQQALFCGNQLQHSLICPN